LVVPRTCCSPLPHYHKAHSHEGQSQTENNCNLQQIGRPTGTELHFGCSSDPKYRCQSYNSPQKKPAIEIS